MKVIRHFFSPLLLRLYAGALMFILVFQGVDAFWNSEWNRWRLYRQIFSGEEDRMEHALAHLYSMRAESQLLMAVRSDSEPIYQAAASALWEMWSRNDDREVYQNLIRAVKAMEEGEHEVALEELNTIIESHPKYAEAWNRRATLHLRMGEFQESVRDGEQAIALNPFHFGAWRAVGLSRLRLGQIIPAREALEISLTLFPHDPDLQDLMDWLRELIQVAPKPMLDGVDREFL